MPAASPLRHSPLDAAHRALGAKMTPFGGWEMPLHYGGVLEEHRQCRQDAVVFDVSHLGSVRVTGPSAFEGLQRLLTNDLTKVGPGRAQYTHLLDEGDGHVVDDIIVWWLPSPTDEPADFLVIPNASNTEPALVALRAAGEGSEVTDVTATRALLAVQGPRAREIVKHVSPEAAEVGRFRVAEVGVGTSTLIAAGTGYTGEDGVELAVPAENALTVWQALVDAGAHPAGLGARDTLRLEMGYPLHGHELGPGITTLQARLDWVVAWDKGEFRGRGALEAQRNRGVPDLLWGIALEARRPPRDGCEVIAAGQRVGRVSSGNFSPSLERGIALAFLDPGIQPGAAVEIVIRDRNEPGTVVDPPFIQR